MGIIASTFQNTLNAIISTRKYWVLIVVLLLSEAKSIFYNSDIKVCWQIFGNEPRYLCNVLEAYSNKIIYITLIFYILFIKTDKKIFNMFFFLLIMASLDFIHLIINYSQGFILLKYMVCALIYILSKSK